MALSQVQCLDDHHVNWRVNESKPEFFYSEDQRLALETLVISGRKAFTDFIQKNGIRQFLSEAELDRIENVAELYRPGYEHYLKPDTPMTPRPGTPVTPGAGEDAGGDGEISLQYWPDRSEFSVAELDLGWPEAISYRGVTRVNVYTQPPSEGQTHIKEVVRKTIAGAQKVIAVVMDVFTDVDIFRDLLDAAYRRKIPVYIIIDTLSVPCFLSMCGQADMHRGHLKNLRVRSCGGVEFLTRSAHKVHGSLKEKFLLVDGDRAISGSYSFTWSSSRLDRNLITVVSGQAVETFDLQFRDLYLQSRGVSLSKIPMADEPIPDPIPQAALAPVSATVARKLINPKYALVAAGTHTSPTSSDQNSSKQNSNSHNPMGLKIMKPRLKEVMEEPPLHPGLAHLEKAYLIPYLPTWPEPDPPSDVIGFINIRDEKRANQVHLQRSERFEVSQAIRFRAPLIMPAQKEEKTTSTPAEKVENTEQKYTGTEVSKQTEMKTLAPANKDQTHVIELKEEPQKTDIPVHKGNKKTTQEIPTSPQNVTEHEQPMDIANQALESQNVAPPIPKRRTLQLLIETPSSEKPAEAQVTLVKMDQVDNDSSNQTTEPEVKMTRNRLQSQREARGSVSNEEGSLDSTKVICDRGVTDDPSSTSTGSEEEFYDAQPEPKDSLINGLTSGSNQGQRQPGDGLNVMARFSQSMLDLREPTQSQDSMALLHQSQQLRRQNYSSPHRHIGQLFQASRSPGRAKVIIGKPGFYRHQYWQTQMLKPDSVQSNTQTRSGRSPRRRSPNFRKGQQTLDHPPANPQGLLGVSFSKLSNLKHLKARAGVSQKKVPQMNKGNR